MHMVYSDSSDWCVPKMSTCCCSLVLHEEHVSEECFLDLCVSVFHEHICLKKCHVYVFQRGRL